MFYVDGDNKLKNTNEEIEVDSKITFFNQDKLFEFNSLNPYIGSFCRLHRTIDFLLESNYAAKIDKVSRTEKNKGEEFASSAYTVTAGLEKIQKEASDIKKEIKMFNSSFFTLRNSSDSFLKLCAKLDTGFFYQGFVNPDTELLEVIKKDTQLYQKSMEQETEIVLMFCPIKVYNYKGGVFELTPFDRSVYLSFLTKFMEMTGNFQIQSEVENFCRRYELWLFYVFRKYFQYDFCDYMFKEKE